VFSPNKVYLVLTRPTRVTLIKFGDTEKVFLLQVGDTVGFDVERTASRWGLIVKPRHEFISTDVVVQTEDSAGVIRTYSIELRSTATEQGKYYSQVQFLYPRSSLVDMDPREGRGVASVPMERQSEVGEKPALTDRVPTAHGLNVVGRGQACSGGTDPQFEYEWNRSSSIAPAQVFSNGRCTYIKFPSRLTELPAVFAEVDGDIALVDYERDPVSGYVVIQRVAPAMRLVLGKEKLTIKRAVPVRSYTSGDL
jgi:type IV secretion system protein VirB9